MICFYKKIIFVFKMEGMGKEKYFLSPEPMSHSVGVLSSQKAGNLILYSLEA